jgi:hypothetical protein
MTAEEAFALGNPQAKMIVHLMAKAVMKCIGDQCTLETQDGDVVDAPISNDDGATVAPKPRPDAPRRRPSRRSPYRDVYDEAKDRYEGEEKWKSDLHRHNSALRVTGKAILKDLWVVAHADLGVGND